MPRTFRALHPRLYLAECICQLHHITELVLFRPCMASTRRIVACLMLSFGPALWFWHSAPHRPSVSFHPAPKAPQSTEQAPIMPFAHPLCPEQNEFALAIASRRKQLDSVSFAPNFPSLGGPGACASRSKTSPVVPAQAVLVGARRPST